MKPYLKVLVFTLVVVLFAIAMAIMPSGADVEDQANGNIYVLEKDGFTGSLGILEENAIAPAFQIDVAKRIEDQKIEKKPRAQTLRQTLKSSLEYLGLTATSGPKQIESGDLNVVLTVYKDEHQAAAQNEEARQAEVFNGLIGPLIGTDIDEAEVRYFKLATEDERLEYINQETEMFGVEISPEAYAEFNAGDNTKRSEQILDLAKKYGIPVDLDSLAVFLKEYSKLIGISPI